MYQSYGNAIRSYAFAARSGRLHQPGSTQLSGEVRNGNHRGGAGSIERSQQCAYGSSFPAATKRFLNGGWYFSMDQAFDLAVASALDGFPPLNDPRPKFLGAILENMNYEGGCNPVQRQLRRGSRLETQRDIVSQFAANDRRALPPSGIPLGNIVAASTGFRLTKASLARFVFHWTAAANAPYPFLRPLGRQLERADGTDVVNQARQLATAAFLMAKTSLVTQPWKSASAQIIIPAVVGISNSATATLNVPDLIWPGALVWEAQNLPDALVVLLRGSRRTIGCVRKFVRQKRAVRPAIAHSAQSTASRNFTGAKIICREGRLLILRLPHDAPPAPDQNQEH